MSRLHSGGGTESTASALMTGKANLVQRKRLQSAKSREHPLSFMKIEAAPGAAIIQMRKQRPMTAKH